MESNQKSFTVIELLVVIALIGLVATIVLVSLRGARQKAKIAAGLQFSDSLRAGLADAIVSWWSFDDGTTRDPWGGNDGTLLPAASPPTPVDGIVRGALEFDGVDDYIEVDDSDSLDVNQITLELWVRPRSFDAFAYVIQKLSAYLIRFSPYRQIHAVIRSSSKSWFCRPSTSILQADQWQHVAMTYSIDTDHITIYFNGVVIKSCPVGAAIDGGILSSAFHLTIGGREDRYWFNGTIDEVRIHNRPLTALEIQKRYVQGLKKYQLAKE